MRRSPRVRPHVRVPRTSTHIGCGGVDDARTAATQWQLTADETLDGLRHRQPYLGPRPRAHGRCSPRAPRVVVVNPFRLMADVCRSRALFMLRLLVTLLPAARRSSRSSREVRLQGDGQHRRSSTSLGSDTCKAAPSKGEDAGVALIVLAVCLAIALTATLTVVIAHPYPGRVSLRGRNHEAGHSGVEESLIEG